MTEFTGNTLAVCTAAWKDKTLPGFPKRAHFRAELGQGNHVRDGAPSMPHPFPQTLCFRSSSWLGLTVLLGSQPEPPYFQRAFLLFLNGVVQNRMFHRACLGAPTPKHRLLPVLNCELDCNPTQPNLLFGGHWPQARGQQLPGKFHCANRAPTEISASSSGNSLVSLSPALLSWNPWASWMGTSRKCLLRRAA